MSSEYYHRQLQREWAIVANESYDEARAMAEHTRRFWTRMVVCAALVYLGVRASSHLPQGAPARPGAPAVLAVAD